MDEIKKEREVLFEMPMQDSTFTLEKEGDQFYIKEVLCDGTGVFEEHIYKGKRLLTILNRIRAN